MAQSLVHDMNRKDREVSRARKAWHGHVNKYGAQGLELSLDG
jgi:hypothetical protein